MRRSESRTGELGNGGERGREREIDCRWERLEVGGQLPTSRLCARFNLGGNTVRTSASASTSASRPC